MSNENNFKPTLEGYKPLRPFNLFMKNNFPFIENTFEALDTYGLICELVKYLNVAIENVNTTEENITLLSNAFNELNDYVSNYFDNLDVQEEINNKLDQLVYDGTLTDILENLFTTLKNKIDAVASGSPAGVYATFDDLSTADPDHSRIYVVTVNGHWYYWDNTTSLWTDGGTYQASEVSENDPTIKKIIDRLDSFSTPINIIEDELLTTIANIGGEYKLYPNEDCLTIVFPIVSGRTYTVYKGYPMGLARYSFSSIFPSENSVVTNYADFSTSANYKTFTATQTGYACIKILDSTETLDVDLVKQSAYVYNGEYDENVTKNTTDLINIKSINNVSMTKIKKSAEIPQALNIIDYFLIAQVTANGVTLSGDGSKLSVVFPVSEGELYTINKTVFTYHTRAGFFTTQPTYNSVPSEFVLLDNGNGCTNITFTAPMSGYACVWILDRGFHPEISIDYMKQNAVVYKGTYSDSIKSDSYDIEGNNIPRVFYCGEHRELSTLKAGIEEATKYMNSILYVDAGTYDLIQEFGSSYFESLTSVNTLAGLILKNNIHVIFDANSKVVSNYSGSNQYARSLYSPFNAGLYGYTLENLNLECSNCRYGIHEERNGATENYKAVIKNCNIYIDNSNNTDWAIHHSIGGGFGANANVTIENCTFDNDDSSNRWGVYYHIQNNSNVNNYRAIFTFKDNYFKKGTLSLDNVASTPDSIAEDSIYIVTNNKIASKYSGTDDQGIYNGLTRNYELLEWNNII